MDDKSETLTTPEALSINVSEYKASSLTINQQMRLFDFLSSK